MTTKKVFFTAGPAQLYPDFEGFIQKALQAQIGSISHRSKQFRALYQETFENLQVLFQLPKDCAVLFTGSATEIWERSLQSLVSEHSFHLINGAFSQKYYDFAVQLHKKPQKIALELGQGFSEKAISIPSETELLCLTNNETSTGAMMQIAQIEALKQQFPDVLFSVDMVSSAPYPAINFQQIDSAFFSIQKGFGLPAGLGVWIVNEKCLEKSQQLDKKQVIGTYHTLPSLWKSFKNFETPETPNVWAIFLLNEVLKAMLAKGIEKIRQETEEKYAILYEFVEKSTVFQPYICVNEDRSKTVIVLNTAQPAEDIIQQVTQKNIVLGAGYGNLKDNQIRIANFPAIGIEDMQKLLNALAEFEKEVML